MTSSRKCWRDRSTALRCVGLRAIRSLRATPAPAPLRAQPQLLDFRRLPGHRRGRARQDFRSHARWSFARSRRANRAATWRPTRPRCCASHCGQGSAVRVRHERFPPGGGLQDAVFERHRP
jgi:hypothetical protein